MDMGQLFIYPVQPCSGKRRPPRDSASAGDDAEGLAEKKASNNSIDRKKKSADFKESIGQSWMGRN
jgi:hypothetical protein